ncbi:RnfH family protein [Halomonas urumqiensis]|uniref:UPF0125 protein C1H70_06090 n=1 Tax=Halomonas urumqiensis TaxID=1684789 RepID=A0A2N7UKZ5_9GAMM|nr:RnfH family protein [Halomonas urumqiensis]PMR81121.1 RnfH family protein [Halomonas urumqiensis]PTB02507.1 RnfH family protein [Halomonas urumqiensis]GHE20978.1 UPF0125 protein [Halomonas urumqiensis]
MADIDVEVAYASPERQQIVSLHVPTGTTARQAVMLARLERHFSELKPDTLADAPLGIFGSRLSEPDTHVLASGDRVEVYRPLQIDPKAARIARASRPKR